MMEKFTHGKQREGVELHMSEAFRSLARQEEESRAEALKTYIENRLRAMAFMRRVYRIDLEHAENRLLHGRIPQPPPRRPEPFYRLANQDKQEAAAERPPARLLLPRRQVLDALGRYERFRLL